jgi:hypothetical protein
MRRKFDKKNVMEATCGSHVYNPRYSGGRDHDTWQEKKA